MFKDVDAVVKIDIIRPIEDSNNNFFNSFGLLVEQIRGDLLVGLKDSKRTKDEQDELVCNIDAIKGMYAISEGDLKGLKQDVVIFGHFRSEPVESEGVLA
jgi:hypothetical protein